MRRSVRVVGEQVGLLGREPVEIGAELASGATSELGSAPSYSAGSIGVRSGSL